MALLLWLAERFGHLSKQLNCVDGRDGLVVGLAQAFALIPGVSRSGSTLTAALFDGWAREDAARFSFLLGVPAISLAGLVELRGELTSPASEGLLPMLVGVFAAAVVSWLAIDWLLKYLQRNSTWIFVVYRLVFGVLLLVWWAGSGSN